MFKLLIEQFIVAHKERIDFKQYICFGYKYVTKPL